MGQILLIKIAQKVFARASSMQKEEHEVTRSERLGGGLALAPPDEARLGVGGTVEPASSTRPLQLPGASIQSWDGVTRPTVEPPPGRGRSPRPRWDLGEEEGHPRA